MKKVNTLFMILFLFMGTFQLQGQVRPAERPCTSISVRSQTCNDDGTVTIVFGVDNNTNTTVTLVNVLDSDGNLVGTSTAPIGPYSTGSFMYTYTGATPGTTECFSLYLYNERGTCCHRRVCIRVQRCCDADCDDFDFTSTANNNFNIGTPMVAESAATIGVTLDGLRVPDSVWVTVNNITVLGFSAGAHPCDGPSWFSVGPQYFTVQPCDVVVFNVLGDVCNLAGSYWELYVACRGRSLTSIGGGTGKGGTVNSPYSNMSDAELMEAEMNLLGLSTQERVNLNSEDAQLGAAAGSLKIFPNPVSDVLNIVSDNVEINYELVKVMDSSGKTIISENMSGKTNLQLDASVLPYGIYIIEVMDDTGNRTVEKFIKSN